MPAVVVPVPPPAAGSFLLQPIANSAITINFRIRRGVVMCGSLPPGREMAFRLRGRAGRAPRCRRQGSRGFAARVRRRGWDRAHPAFSRGRSREKARKGRLCARKRRGGARGGARETLSQPHLTRRNYASERAGRPGSVPRRAPCPASWLRAHRVARDVRPGLLALVLVLTLAGARRELRPELLDGDAEVDAALLQPGVLARQDGAPGPAGELVMVVPERVEQLLHPLALLHAEGVGERQRTRRFLLAGERQRLRPRDARGHGEELGRDV